MKKLNIALLSGGRSSEREVSLKGGDQVLEALDKEKYHVVRYDPKTDLKLLMADAEDIDLALIILHGPYGEDGTIQGFLDLLDIPYQGAGVLGSALAMNKVVSKEIYRQNNIPTPPYRVLRQTDLFDAGVCMGELGLPIVVKPSGGGSSIGMTLAKTEMDLNAAVDKAFSHDPTLVLEAYLKGIELTVSVLGNEHLHALPVIEIVPDGKYDFFEYEAKYTQGETKEICPARIDDHLTEKAQNLAKKAHLALSLRGYSRSDMICRDGEIYVLETNTIPGMTETSLLPLAAKTAGMSFSQLLDQLIELGLKAHLDRKKIGQENKFQRGKI